MDFDPPLIQATFISRYKRFLADVELASGEVITVHCANTGSMKNCLVPGSRCWISLSANPARKLPGTLEIVTTRRGQLAGVNTARPNQLVREAIAAGAIAELTGYDTPRREVTYGAENSRIDLLLSRGHQHCYVEVKNVTLEDDAEEGLALFPDAVTARGTKHLRELMTVVKEGQRGVLLFCVQYSGARAVAPAAAIDPLYSQTLAEAVAAGVEVLAYRCRLSATEIALAEAIDFRLPLCDIA